MCTSYTSPFVLLFSEFSRLFPPALTQPIIFALVGIPAPGNVKEALRVLPSASVVKTTLCPKEDAIQDSSSEL